MKIGDRVKISGKNHAFENHTGVIIGDEMVHYNGITDQPFKIYPSVSESV